jgi:two-component system phosphate regulon sensor histidine kinase PhoR
VNLSSLIDKAVSKHSIVTEKRNARIKLDLDPNPIILNGDEFHLTHALSNLVDNAIKYSEDAPDIVITTRQTGDQVYCSFQDAGMGIARNQQGKIFQKLYRVPTGNIHSVKGNGLGLSYVRSVVENHKGSIQVKSELGKGSNFELIFPAPNGQA